MASVARSIRRGLPSPPYSACRVAERAFMADFYPVSRTLFWESPPNGAGPYNAVEVTASPPGSALRPGMIVAAGALRPDVEGGYIVRLASLTQEPPRG